MCKSSLVTNMKSSLIFITTIILIAGCIEQPTAPPAQEYLDDLGCFPQSCDLPPGMKELCQDYKAGAISWPADCNDFRDTACRQLCEREKSGTQPTSDMTTFTVTIPENSFFADGVYIQLWDKEDNQVGNVKMQQINEHVWQTQLPIHLGTTTYRYNIDSQGFLTAEEFTPDSEDAKRSVELQPGKNLTDTVSKWRWWPAPGEELPEVESAAEETEILPRINAEKLQRGYQHVDFWWQPFEIVASSTNEGMKKANANWIKIAPAWDYAQSDPVPVITPEGFGHTYSDEELELHMAEIRKSGLNIFMEAQICCNEPDPDAEYSQEWWDAWFGEMDKFAVYFAEKAEKYDVEYMRIGADNMWKNPHAPDDIEERYAHFIDTVREHYSGKIALSFISGPDYEHPEAVFPDFPYEYEPDRVDFINFAIATDLSKSKTPTIKEMKKNIIAVRDAAIKPLYDKYKKPVVIIFSTPSIDGGAANDYEFDCDEMQQFAAYSNRYELDLEEQALAYEAVMQVVAETPYIIGTYPFNAYWPMPAPLSKNFDIWGKPAEDTMAGWYERFEEQDSEPN
ncbi:MAG: hypothetical protein JW834_03105 [Candidatus Diapherotrites archaeon]|nr:hypothetical protein [Candidatus Diapherotrites archaeon]